MEEFAKNRISPFCDRLLVVSKFKELIKEIHVATDGSKPKFQVIESMVSDSTDDIHFRERLLAVLRESHFKGPRSNPYFIVYFENGMSRVVIPEQSDPTKLILQADIDTNASVAQLFNGPGSTDVKFP